MLLMPKATIVWLVDNTALSFEQIAEFCKVHILEVKGIADGDVAVGIKGADPISSGQLTREEIERCEADPKAKIEMAKAKRDMPPIQTKQGRSYTPVSKRQERPNAIAWLVRNHEELNDAQVSRLVGTTKPTIQAIRNRNHWNSANISPMDPVTLGLCSQMELDKEVSRAAKRAANKRKIEEKAAAERGEVLKTPEESLAEDSESPKPESSNLGSVGSASEEPSAENVFGDAFSNAEKAQEEKE
ncbi:MAG: DUF1013 domain-containing protein [Parvibaculales bacterium]